MNIVLSCSRRWNRFYGGVRVRSVVADPQSRGVWPINASRIIRTDRPRRFGDRAKQAVLAKVIEEYVMRRILTIFQLIAISQFLAGSAEAANAVCNPADVAQLESRIHIRCDQPISDGAAAISWFALPTVGSGDESKTASRFMAVGMMAIAIGKPINFWFIPGDTSGASYGCGADNCRRPVGFFLLK